MFATDFYYYLSPAGRSAGGEPVTPLPFPGEGGPVYPGDNTPVVPLPFPGEGGPVYPGDNTPAVPLPSPGEGGPVYPGDNTPAVPLPSPGEGGPVYPGSEGGCTYPSGGIRPRSARVRFLNAAYGYPAFRISIGGSRIVNQLNYASVTGCSQIRSGYHTVTVSDANGRIYVQKSLPFQSGRAFTVAVIRTAGGLDLMQIPDRCCPSSGGSSSFRVGNLAYNSTPLDVVMSDGRVVFGDLRYKEVASFKRIMPGRYQFFYADTNQTPMPAVLDIEPLDSAWLGVYPPYETFGSLLLDVTSRGDFTVYLLQNGTGRNNIQNLILVDQA